MRQALTTSLVILLSLQIVGSHVMAQSTGDKKRKAAAGKAAGKSKAGVRGIVSKWDANGDGLLQASEIPKAALGKVQSTAKERGLDPDKPIPIGRLLGGSGDANAKSSKRLAKSAEKAEQKAEQKANRKKTADQPASQVRGFGQASENKKAGAAGGSDKKASGEAKKAAMRKRFAPMAKAMMYQHDRNKNGRLDKAEWSRLKGNPGESDADRNGSLSMSELTDHLAGFGSREKDVTARSRERKRKSYTNKSGEKRSYRFLTPHERLPKGLPAWFVESDVNGDGQLSLKEYASRLQASKIGKFMQFDLNKDGFVVATEYLKATDVE